MNMQIGCLVPLVSTTELPLRCLLLEHSDGTAHMRILPIIEGSVPVKLRPYNTSNAELRAGVAGIITGFSGKGVY